MYWTPHDDCVGRLKFRTISSASRLLFLSGSSSSQARLRCPNCLYEAVGVIRSKEGGWGGGGTSADVSADDGITLSGRVVDLAAGGCPPISYTRANIYNASLHVH